MSRKRCDLKTRKRCDFCSAAQKIASDFSAISSAIASAIFPRLFCSKTYDLVLCDLKTQRFSAIAIFWDAKLPSKRLCVVPQQCPQPCLDDFPWRPKPQYLIFGGFFLKIFWGSKSSKYFEDPRNFWKEKILRIFKNIEDFGGEFSVSSRICP